MTKPDTSFVLDVPQTPCCTLPSRNITEALCCKLQLLGKHPRYDRETHAPGTGWERFPLMKQMSY